MLDILMNSVISETLTFSSVILCTVTSLLLGISISAIYMSTTKYTKSFAVTLALLPAMVQVVLMFVNGNIGTGVAVAGAFSLIRFRSVAGNARDIGNIFFAMITGIATGMGYLFYAVLFLIIIGSVNLILSKSKFAEEKQDIRMLKIVIPENLDYEGLFDDLFEEYTDSFELDQVKTTNMGSLYELRYVIRLKTEVIPKAFIDEIRCRNGNLNIIFGRTQSNKDEL